MACKVIMMEVAKSGGIHMSESCPLGWLSPTKISSSTDFDALHAQEASHIEHVNKEKSNDRDSISEFEFAMSAIKHENVHGEHMLAADELFFKGKLLPLYNPPYTDGSEAHHICGCDMHVQADRHSLSNHPTSSCPLYITDAENSHAIDRDSITPLSPKAPKCSIMLKELFGLKKMAKSICACTASGEVKATGSSCKSSRCGAKKGKAAKNKQKASLVLQANVVPPSSCKARHLSCASRNAECIPGKARNSASEPLLKCRVTQLACPQADQCTNAIDIACMMHRSSRVSDSLNTNKDLCELTDDDDQCRKLTEEQNAESGGRSLQMCLGKSSNGAPNCEMNKCLELSGAQNKGFTPMLPEGMRLGDMSYEEDKCRPLTREQSRESTRTHSGQLDPEQILHSSPSFEGNTCRESAGKHNRGKTRRAPLQVVAAGESNPEQIPCRNLSYGENTSREGGRIMRQMGTHIGKTSPEGRSSSGLNAMASHLPQSKTLKSTEIVRTRSLERSSSYSPKSLQRKYEQLKAMRQREGWRMLERSSSYNSGLHSMRVAPVLNVPIVCMSRSKSSNHGMHARRKA